MTDSAVTDVRKEVVVTINGQDLVIPMESLSLTINSTERDILNIMRPIIQEREGMDIQDDDGDYSYTIRKAMNTEVIHIYPKPVAG